MKLLMKNRGMGKTTQLILTSEVMGYPIVTATHNGAEYIKHKAKELNCNIPTVYVVEDFRNGSGVTRGVRDLDNVLLDDVECILEKALKEYLGGTHNIVVATMSNPNERFE